MQGLRRTRALVAAAVTGFVALLVVSVPAKPAHAETPFVLLQMNLCNSGLALSCYTFGQSVTEAAEKIRQYRPEMVTLQEICRDDVYSPTGWGKLGQAMADIYGSKHVSVSFVPAVNRDTKDWYRCTDDEPFGDALMYHYANNPPRSGWYQSEDTGGEIREWTCVTVIRGRLTACTTHLSTYPLTAGGQCRELSAILAASWVMPEVIVAGDFNLLGAPGIRDVRGCFGASYNRRDDGSVQQVFFTPGVQWVQGQAERMRKTDHPLLYEKFRV